MNSKNILEVKKVSKSYKDFKLDNISFNLPYGNIMGLIGGNGAGKTTLLQSILDIISRDTGEINIFGEKLEDNSISIKDKIGFVFDDINFYDKFTPKEIGNILKPSYTNWSDEIYYKYLEKFKIGQNKEIKSLSKGMKTKVSIALALAQQPELLILDEPTSGLDPISRNELLDIFLDFIQNPKSSILISSHITTDLEKIADYITFIDNGQLVFSKTKDELIYQYGIVKCGKENFEKISSEDIISYRKLDYNYELLVENKEDFSNKYSKLEKIIIERPSIEEIMILMTKGGVKYE